MRSIHFRFFASPFSPGSGILKDCLEERPVQAVLDNLLHLDYFKIGFKREALLNVSVERTLVCLGLDSLVSNAFVPIQIPMDGSENIEDIFAHL